MKNRREIDFVVPWVDDTDPIWCAKKARYTGNAETEGNTAVRYRDWDTLRYWFRGVEKFAPWVRYVHFVTDDQKPAWLNVDHPKLRWVKHTDFIPEEYLPTFQVNPIELNLHRIPDLADHFVYFNDDVFLIKETTERDFFVNGFPCDFPILGPLLPSGFFSYILFNNINLLNRHFSLKESIKENPWKWMKAQPMGGLLKLALYGRRNEIPNSVSKHIHTPFLKHTFDVLWEKEYDVLHATCQHKQRTKEDISAYCIRDWQLFSGEFYPQKPIGKLFHTASMAHNDEAIEYLRKQKGKVICLNDSEDEVDFELHKKLILEAFEKLLPEKSSFEL